MGSKKEDVQNKSLLGKRSVGPTYLQISDSFLRDMQVTEGGSPSVSPLSYSFGGDSGGGSGGNGSGGGGGGDDGDPTPITLDDVGGLTEQVNFIKRAVLFPLTQKVELSKWGFIPPKGIMFYGSPGTGKTLLAKAMATELTRDMNTKVHFIYRKGTDCHSKWFGQSSANLRKIFKEAEEQKPCLLFFDEIDGLCPNRETSGQTSEVYASVVTTFLGMMDSIKPGEIFVIAATNRLDSLDPALRRPGRFDKELGFNPPDESARISILKIHTKKWGNKVKPSEALIAEIAAATPGYTGAYLQNLCAQASNCAIQRYKTVNKLDMITGAHLAKIDILKEDWFEAVRLVGRPKINSFGSNLYVPQSEPKVMPLMAEQASVCRQKILKMSPFDENHNRVKSFYVYGCKTVVSTFLIPEMLKTKDFQKIPIFQLDLENISRDYYSEVGRLINQVNTCTKPCILYMPNCEVLFDTLANTDKKKKTSLLPFLINKLTLTSSRSVLILGTAACSSNNLPEEAKTIFTGDRLPEYSYKMRVPTENERQIFFQSVLNKDSYGGEAMSGPEWDAFFKTTLDTCVAMTDQDPIDYLVDLHSELLLTGKQFMINDESFIKKMTEVVKKYRTK